MLYATTSCTQNGFSGHVNQQDLADNLNTSYYIITEIQADGDELLKCCEILDRRLPNRRVYTFLGNNAQEIAKNWDTK
jgi:hypothetical protein